MKMHEMLSESKVNEAPMGMIQRGVQGLKSMVPGSIGQKATGSLEAGKAANQLYKEYNTYLGRTGQQMSQQSLVAFLKSAGIPSKIINSAAGVTPAPRRTRAPAPTPAPAPAPTPEAAPPPAPAAAFGKKQVNAILMKVSQALGGAAPQAQPAAPQAQPAAPSAPAAAATPAAPTPAPAASPSAAPAPAPAVPKVGAKQAKAQINQAVNNIQGIRTRDRANVVNYAKQKVNALTESAILNDIKKLAGLK